MNKREMSIKPGGAVGGVAAAVALARAHKQPPAPSHAPSHIQPKPRTILVPVAPHFVQSQVKKPVLIGGGGGSNGGGGGGGGGGRGSSSSSAPKVAPIAPAAAATQQASLMTVTCPHCGGMVVVDQLNCRIFRHAVYKSTGQQVPPHASKAECDALVKEGKVYGCGMPFRVNEHGVAEKCGYI